MSIEGIGGPLKLSYNLNNDNVFGVFNYSAYIANR